MKRVFPAAALLLCLLIAPQGLRAEQASRQYETGYQQAAGNIMRQRVIDRRVQEDLIALYPDRLRLSPDCFEAALSNYIEDLWSQVGAATGCASTTDFCVPDKTAQSTDPDSLTREIALANVWPLSAAAYKILRGILPSFGNETHATEPGAILPYDLAVQVKSVKDHLASCMDHPPAVWIRTDQPLPPQSPLTADSMKLGMYQLLAGTLTTQALLPQDRDIPKCLQNYMQIKYARTACTDGRSCRASIPADDPDILRTRLDDLTQHQCSQVYIYKTLNADPTGR